MKSVFFLLFSFFIAAATQADTEKQSARALPNQNTVVGQIDGENVLLKDIETKKINDLRVQLHDALEAEFQDMAVKTLADKDDSYMNLPIDAITDQDIRAFYSNNQLQRQGTLQQLTPQISMYISAYRLKNKIYQIAMEKKALSSNLFAPEVFTVAIPVETAFLRGNEQATTMLMEFSDYQCPYCQSVQPTIQSLIKKYGESVAFGYRHFPLNFHKEARGAAVAIECARDQGKFNEMHALLFQQQRDQSKDDLKALAERIELADMEAFNQCLDDDKYGQRVARDIVVGQSVGINGTPGFIVGRYDPKTGRLTGELLSGARPASSFTEILDKYLNN